MNRSIALAYGITGLAVAAALVVIVGVTTGLFRTDPPSPVADGAVATQPAAPAPTAPPLLMPEAAPAPGVPSAVGQDEQIVYVDAPPSTRRGHHDDDDDDDDDDDRRGGRGHREHDDD